MVWNEVNGQVTRAFDAWRSTEADIRAFLELSRRWVTDAYDSEWAGAQQDFEAIFDPDRHDTDGHVDVFHERIKGLWANDYFWMLRSGALRDAVSAFEVYAENSLEEMLSRHTYGVANEDPRCRLALKRREGQMSPQWDTLRRVHGAIGSTIDTPEVKYIRTLRHLLTHQRGRLRTEDERLKLVAEGDKEDWLVGEAYVGGDVPLSDERVLEMITQLGDTVRACDRLVFPIAWGDTRPPGALQGLTRGDRAALEYRPLD